MVEILPAILTQNLEDFQSKIKLIEGFAEKVQIDVIDGIFLPERTVGLEFMSSENFSAKLKIDLHLMVNRPEEWVARAVETLPEQIIGQIERMQDREGFVTQVIEAGIKVGLALDLKTPASVVDPELLTKVDTILIMTRRAGFNDSIFDETALEKVRYFRKIGGEYLKICVDGGINKENIKKCVQSGADVVAVGGDLWKAPDIDQELKNLNSLLDL